MLDWMHAGPSMTTAFVGSTVEVVEAMTIVLAVGTVRGWRSALLGAIAGITSLALIVLIFGPAIAQIPITMLQVVVGALLLLFGMRWLRKAILRYGGLIALHDEDATFARETQQMRDASPHQGRAWDPIAVATSFKAVMLEGIEVVVIVLGVGAVGGMLVPASLGALAACVLVTIVGALLHRPLSRVPENALKFTVGVIITAFGMFWFGEGIGITWPYHDAAILGLAALLLVVSRMAITYLRGARPVPQINSPAGDSKI
jgi:Ca2+/H+ antiporter, TMEM165/GDT1 family